MASFYYSRPGNDIIADAVRTALAGSKVRCYKSSLTPTVNTPIATFTGSECDFTGYNTEGYDITNFAVPVYDPIGQAVLNSPLVAVTTASSGAITPNIVGGCWLEDIDGVLIGFCNFDAPITLNGVSQGIPILISLPFGATR